MNLEKYSKILILFSGIVLILIGVPRLVLNQWLPLANYFFYFALALFALSLALNYKSLFDLMTMRTTKYGVNMGTLIALSLLLFTSINFLASRYDKSVDITSDKLNSLSLQSTDILSKLEQDIVFKVYYQGDVQANSNIALKLLFKKYQRESKKVKVTFVDALKDPKSSQFLRREDKGKQVVFVTRGDRHERVSEPISEESITSALYRIEKDNNKIIYFLTGHGERSLTESKAGEGLKLLNAALNEKGFKTAELNLIQKRKIPWDASMLAWVGPKTDFLDYELKVIKDYIDEGGRFLAAIDPSSKVKVNTLANEYGVSYEKTFLLTTQPIAGGDALAIVGQVFAKDSGITEKLDEKSITLFYEATELKKSDKALDYKVKNLVETIPSLIPVRDLKTYKEEVAGKTPQSSVLAMSSKGLTDHSDHNHDGEPERDRAFYTVFYGDSDFLSDIYFDTGFNKDLALNSFASLSGETDLLSIRPRVAKTTNLVLTLTHQTILLVVPLMIPLVLLILASILWFRRRGA